MRCLTPGPARRRCSVNGRSGACSVAVDTVEGRRGAWESWLPLQIALELGCCQQFPEKATLRCPRAAREPESPEGAWSGQGQNAQGRASWAKLTSRTERGS